MSRRDVLDTVRWLVMTVVFLVVQRYLASLARSKSGTDSMLPGGDYAEIPEESPAVAGV